MKYCISILVFFLSFFSSFSQKEAYNWYFGNNCALSFSTSPPNILNNSSITSFGGSGASVSDKNGNLLFYTNGSTIWNNQHNVMANGSGLFGGGPAEQAALAVKQPGNYNIYFIFTNLQAGYSASNGGFRYSIVDMTLAAGLGSVTAKNNILFIPGTEKVTATRHCNGSDIWIVTHEPGTNNFLSYLLTSVGINTVPVISSLGPIYCNQIGCGGGQLKFNVSGSQLLDAENGLLGSLTIYNFDKASGIISNPLTLSNNLSFLGADFSSDGSKVYANDVSNFYYINQWDLCAGSSGAIIASRDTIGVSSSTSTPFGLMQLAPDGKIYISRATTSTLAVINSPNKAGSACNFVEFGQSVGTSPAKGLPGFMSNLLQPVFTYTTSANCAKASFSAPAVSCIQAPAITGYQWNFGDPVSGTSNTSSVANPTHQFSSGGIYTVTSIISYSSCAADTFKLEVNIPSTPQVTLSGKQSICKNESTNIAVVNSASSYTWSNGATSPSVSLSPSVTGVYSVSVTYTNSCVANKLFTITVKACTDLSELSDLENQIQVYPNPHHNEITIDVKENFQAVLLDYTGRIVKTQKLLVGKNNLPVEENSSGIYFLRLMNENHSTILKVVKE